MENINIQDEMVKWADLGKDNEMSQMSKKFHFQEMDWIVSFPEIGNKGRKYLYYTVSCIDRKKGNFKDQACLSDILEKPEFENGFPHTVGFFKAPADEMKVGSCYLEIRIIQSIEEFWKFLNDLDL